MMYDPSSSVAIADVGRRAVAEAAEPRPAYTVSASAGTLMTPTAMPSSSSRARRFVYSRHSVGERLGAVDRVDDPAPARRTARLGFLFAEDAVVGVTPGQLLAEQPFGSSVRFGDRRAVALAVDLQVGGAEVLKGQLAGEVGEGDRFLEQLGLDRRRHRRIMARCSEGLRRGPSCVVVVVGRRGGGGRARRRGRRWWWWSGASWSWSAAWWSGRSSSEGLRSLSAPALAAEPTSVTVSVSEQSRELSDRGAVAGNMRSIGRQRVGEPFAVAR